MTIYFVQRTSDDAIKIGYSKFINNRLMQLRSDHGDLAILGVMRGCRKQETEIHKRFSTDCIKGEWFYPSSKIIDFITNHTIPYVPLKDGRIRQNIPLEIEIYDQLHKQAKSEHRTAPQHAAYIITRHLEEEAGLPLCAICQEPVEHAVICCDKCMSDMVHPGE